MKIEPTSFSAGDTVRWIRDDIIAEYPGALAYVFVGPSNPVAVAAAGDGSCVLTSAQTLSMSAGRWSWTATVTVSSERTTVGSGYVTVKVNPATQSAVVDNRSHARRVLEAIEATIEGRATESQNKLTLSDGRSIESVSIATLISARDLYRAEVQREDAAARLARGERGRNRILVRM